MNVIFDTETTGLPPKGGNWKTHFNEFPYIVQLSWKRSDQDYVHDYIINNGVTIPDEAAKIHGITTEIASASKHTFFEAVSFFLHDCKHAEHIIAHNGYFDISITKANILRDSGRGSLFEKSLVRLHKDKRIDTMMKTIKFCSIPFPNGRGGWKFPKLEELYMKLFNESFPAHNAKHDVLATERCYLELVKRGII